MTERICLRCDWTGEQEEPACPRCGAPLYSMDRPEPPPARPAATPAPRGAPLGAASNDEEFLPPVAAADRGRWRVIALALTLTAVVVFALTRGGESDPERGLGEHPRSELADPTSPSPATTSPPVLPACSGDATPPELAAPAEAVPAATADYLFQGSLESSLGTAPDLVGVVRGSSVFTVDGRTGTTVLRFAGGRGLALAPTTRVVPSSEYTIEVLFRFDLLSGYRKIIDFKDGSKDDGLYALDGCLTFFPTRLDGLTSIGSGSYVQVVLTRDAAGRVVAYVDGVRQFAFNDGGGLAKIDASSTLRFFVDDHTTTGEYSSGAVSQIRLFDQPLTEREVAALACTELAIADATYACRELQR